MSDLMRCEVSPILSGADELVGIQITLETSRARTVLHASKADLEKALARGGLALVPAAEWERSRYKGCGSYPRAIGEIEGILGITGNVPLSETVDAVRKLAAKEANRG